MPMYTWKEKKCGEEVQVVRAVVDIETPPQSDECKCRCQDPEWERLLCAAQFRLIGTGFHCNDYHSTGPRRR